MSRVPVGPQFRRAMRQLRGEWSQGQHVLITGATGTGKTTLASRIVQQRVDNGGCVVLFACKLKPDATIRDEYPGWVTWKKWRARRPGENRIILEADTRKHNLSTAPAVQKAVFLDALNKISREGNWTVVIDEGLYFSSPSFLGLQNELAMMHALGRSAGITVVTLAQRPSHIPLIIYSSASHMFIGMNNEPSDAKRLKEASGRWSGRVLGERIARLGGYEYLWVPSRSRTLEPVAVQVNR